MANTPFLNLVKPTDTDQALITDINNNSDKIDTGVSTLSEQITQYVKYIDITLPQKTVSAGSNETWSAVDISSNIPTGYTAIGVVPRYSGSSGNCVFTMANVSSNKIDANVANISGSSQTPAPHVAIICIKE